MNYSRVIPRDFFNESKLLKCLGQFQLCVLDSKVGGLKFEIEYDGSPFDIQQNNDDGSLSCVNYFVSLRGHSLYLYTPYNSKSNYPILALYRGEEYYLFDESGKFMPNFGVLNETK